MNYKMIKKLYEDATNNSFEEKVAEVKQQLQNGADPEDVFDWTCDFYNGFAEVGLGDKSNFIDRNGNILSDLWFDWVGYFREGFAKVQLEDKWNLINTDGKLLRDDMWFDRVWNFQNGFAKGKLIGKLYYFDTEGNLYDEDENLIKKFNENRQRTVRITESQLRNTIKRVVAQYLNESRR